ncbi:glycosyltransferase family 2 protein [Propionibacteriaceae bacterium Y1685]
MTNYALLHDPRRSPHSGRRQAGVPVIKLSVIVPFYNLQTLAPQTLRNLARAADPEVEFLLIDDCSTDDTLAVLNAGVDKVRNARVIAKPRNSGLSATRNVGLDEATGEYLTFFDGDDFVSPTYFRDLLDEICRRKVDMVRTDHVQVEGRIRRIQRVPNGFRGGLIGVPRDAILPVDRSSSVDYPYAWAGIYHRRLLDAGLLHFREDLRTCEDRPWIWNLHLKAESMVSVSNLGIFYRRDVVNSLSRIGDTKQLDFFKAFDSIVADVSDDVDADLLLPKALRTYASLICFHLDNTERYDPPIALTLRDMSAEHLQQLPRAELGRVMADMDEGRQKILNGLLTGGQ